jgi:hypothetical protein
MTSLPTSEDAERLTAFLRKHRWWSVFWDKRYGLWRVAEDDPDSDLYAEGADTVLGYMTTHS